MKLTRFLVGAALAAAFAFPAHAQFLGFTSPQTITQKIFSGQTTPTRTPPATLLACIPTNGTPCGIPNQGQTFHYLTYVPSTSACVIAISIQASYDGVNFFDISPNATANNILLGQGAGGAGVYANGWFPVLAANLTNISNCPGGVSAFYSGTSSSTSNTFGVFTQATGLQQTLLQNNNLSGASTTVVNLATPTNSTGGRIYLTCTVTCGAGSNTFNVLDVPSPPQTQRTLATFTAANSTALQTFIMPALTAQFIELTFPLGSFASTNVTAYYVFDSPGSPQATANVYREINSNTTTQLRTGVGFLETIVVNNPGSAWTLQVFDNTSCSGQAIAGATAFTVPTAGSNLRYNINFNTGLCLLTAGTTPGSITVSYR